MKRQWFPLFLLAALANQQSGICERAADPFDCQWTSGTSGSYKLRAVTYGNGKFVAVGFAGTILVSADGTNWNNHSSRIANSIIGINYDSETYVAEGNSVTLIQNATNRDVFGGNPLQNPSLNAVTCGSSQFVAVGEHGLVVSSPDGDSWTLRSSAAGNTHLLGAGWGSGKFVVAGESGIVLASEDGVAWTRRYTGTSYRLRAVAFGNNAFVVVGDGNTILHSTDGDHWKRVQPPRPDVFKNLGTVAFGNGRFVAGKFLEEGPIFTSSDGLTWDEAGSPPDVPTGLTFGGGIFVSVGRTGRHLVSSDGDVWTGKWRPDMQLWFEDVCYGNGLFVAVGLGFSAISRDGLSWDFRAEMPLSRLVVGFQMNRETIVTAAHSGPFLDSTNGTVWLYPHSRPDAGNVYGNPTFIVHGGPKRPGLDREVVVLYSTDGISWRKFDTTKDPQPARLASSSIANQQVESSRGLSAITRSAIRASDGAFEFSILAATGRVYRIQASTDLVSWVDLGLFTNAATAMRLLDTDAKNFAHRFYRAVSP